MQNGNSTLVTCYKNNDGKLYKMPEKSNVYSFCNAFYNALRCILFFSVRELCIYIDFVKKKEKKIRREEMKVNGFWKKTLCLVLAMAMVLGNASPVVAAHEHETAAEIVTEITNATIKEAEKVIDKAGLLDAADVTDTKNALEEADSNLAGSMDNLGTAVEDAQA